MLLRTRRPDHGRFRVGGQLAGIRVQSQVQDSCQVRRTEGYFLGQVAYDPPLPNCRKMSKAKVIFRSASAVSFDRKIVASVDRRATVTARSKAFSFDCVCLPKIRSGSTNAA